LDNTSQILERSPELFSGRRVLLVNPPADNLTSSVQADWQVWTWDWSVQRSLATQLGEERLSFSHLCPQFDGLDAAILVVPKALERAEYALAQIVPQLPTRYNGHPAVSAAPRSSCNLMAAARRNSTRRGIASFGVWQ
jgi:16S rRNA (guanine1207-N2)-methyltransferase